MWLVLPADGEPSCRMRPWQIAEARRRSGIERWHGAPGPVSAVVDWIHESGGRRLVLAGSEWLPAAARQALADTGAELVEAGAELAGSGGASPRWSFAACGSQPVSPTRRLRPSARSFARG